MNNKEILQMALEALSAPNQGPLVNTLKNKAIDALVSALAQPEQQSVPMSEYRVPNALGKFDYFSPNDTVEVEFSSRSEPLYSAALALDEDQLRREFDEQHQANMEHSEQLRIDVRTVNTQLQQVKCDLTEMTWQRDSYYKLLDSAVDIIRGDRLDVGRWRKLIGVFKIAAQVGWPSDLAKARTGIELTIAIDAMKEDQT
jgi:hypothetical protein